MQQTKTATKPQTVKAANKAAKNAATKPQEKDAATGALLASLKRGDEKAERTAQQAQANKPAAQRLQEKRAADTAAKEAAKASQKSAETDKANKATAQAELARQAASKASAPYYAALLASALSGALGERPKAFYKRAESYHASQKTAFPRSGKGFEAASSIRNAMLSAAPATAKAWAESILARIVAGTLASKSADGNALYDLMRMGADLPKGAK